MKNMQKTSLIGATLLLAAIHGEAQTNDQVQYNTPPASSGPGQNDSNPERYDHPWYDHRWYLDVDAGGSWTQDTWVKESPFGSGGHIRFDAGARGDVDLGYQLNPVLAAEVESGFNWNSVRSIQGNHPDGGADANFYEVPILANLVLKPWHGPFQPYVGVGAGAAASVFDISGVTPFNNMALFGSDFNDTDWTFAYQGKIGFKFAICHNVDFGLGYKFLGTTDHRWSDHGVTLKTDNTYTHAIVADLTFRF
jgi:opacity protein-like surface antigen